MHTWLKISDTNAVQQKCLILFSANSQQKLFHGTFKEEQVYTDSLLLTVTENPTIPHEQGGEREKTCEIYCRWGEKKRGIE